MNTETLINALRVLALDIQSDDGVANSVVAQAANELEDLVKKQDELIDAFEEIIAISDRQHDAWYKAKQLIAKAKGEK